MYDVAIIGAGVAGASIARELSKYELKSVILDKGSDASAGASKANSGIVHAGFDPEEGTLMAKFNAEANKMFDVMCKELSVPFERNGSLVVAFDDEQLEHIKKLYQRGINNGIPGLSLLSTEDLLKKEPAVNPEAKGALFAETAGIIDPMLLTISLVENAVMNGAEYLFNFEVESIEKEQGKYKIISGNRSVTAKYVVNAAGVYADKIHNMVSEPAFTIKPSRGQYFMLDKAEAGVVRATIFPCPSKAGKGIIVAPTVHGNVILGPTAEDVLDREDVGTTDEMLEQASAGIKLLVPSLSAWRNNIRIFAGLRAVSDIDDFIIGEADGAPNFIDVAGIKSPGLTAAPAVAVYVVSLMAEKGLALNINKSFNPIVKRQLLIDMTEEEQAALIKTNPLYGRVVCRCENITEGDIVDAIKRPAGAVTMDGVKRRCRAGMGRCQGGFCGPKVQHILARELNKPLDEIVLEKKSSYILTGRTK